MARIRIVDAWLRCPAAPASRQRAVMVVAEKWAEQRVLMRAYANSQDQTRPTIVLHGSQLAIGPAGTDPAGAWGIHVEPPVDGRAQELRAQLELAARRLAGSKGNPPRLMDETPSFDGRATNHWEPGTAPDLPTDSGQSVATRPYYEPSASSSSTPAMAPFSAVTPMPGPPPPAPPLAGNEHRGWSSPIAATPPLRDTQPASGPSFQSLGQPLGQPSGGWPASSARMPGSPTPVPYRSPKSVKTERGIALGHGASWPQPGDSHSRQGATDLRAVIRQTMPPGFQLSPTESEVLDALGASTVLTAGQVEHLTHAADPGAWMERFMAKLAGFGLDVIQHGGYVNGEATYLLRR